MKINFDDITNEASPYQNIPANYQEFNWSEDIYVISAFTYEHYVGGHNMVTSGEYAILLEDVTAIKTISSPEKFNFLSAALTSYGASTGFADGVEKYNRAVNITNTAQVIDFNFLEIDELTFTQETGAWLALDDITVATATENSDTPGITISGTDLLTSEKGDTAQFNVQLNTSPKRDVTITFISSDLTEGVISNGKLLL